MYRTVQTGPKIQFCRAQHSTAKRDGSAHAGMGRHDHATSSAGRPNWAVQECERARLCLMSRTAHVGDVGKTHSGCSHPRRTSLSGQSATPTCHCVASGRIQISEPQPQADAGRTGGFHVGFLSLLYLQAGAGQLRGTGPRSCGCHAADQPSCPPVSGCCPDTRSDSQKQPSSCGHWCLDDRG